MLGEQGNELVLKNREIAVWWTQEVKVKSQQDKWLILLISGTHIKAKNLFRML